MLARWAGEASQAVITAAGVCGPAARFSPSHPPESYPQFSIRVIASRATGGAGSL